MRWLALMSLGLAAAGAAWGRGVPAYREYSEPIRFGERKSALSDEVGADEARRLELRAAAARADIVGNEPMLDLFNRGSSPFSGGRGGAMAAVGTGGTSGGDSGKERERGTDWLVEGLKLESLTTTNKAVLQGMGLDGGEEGMWGWLADEVQGLGEARGLEEGGQEDRDPTGEGGGADAMAERLATPDAGIGGDLNLDAGRETASGARANAGTDGGTTGTTTTDLDRRMADGTPADNLVPAGDAAVARGGAPSDGTAAELTRVKDLLATLSGEAGDWRGMSGVERDGGAIPGMSAGRFAPDWDSLLKAGRVNDLTAAMAGRGNGGAIGAEGGGEAAAGFAGGWTAGAGGGGGEGWRWQGMDASVGRSAERAGGWTTGGDAPGGGTATGRSGGWDGMPDWLAGTPGMGGTVGPSAVATPTLAGPEPVGESRASWSETRPAGGGYRPAWD